eukprot:scaffold208620_cov21-Tisochrysis_lutea.AAC.1
MPRVQSRCVQLCCPVAGLLCVIALLVLDPCLPRERNRKHSLAFRCARDGVFVDPGKLIQRNTATLVAGHDGVSGWPGAYPGQPSTPRKEFEDKGLSSAARQVLVPPQPCRVVAEPSPNAHGKCCT